MKLYVVISDSGDGSYRPRFISDVNVLTILQNAYDEDVMDYENGWGCDGDGFHYTTLTIAQEEIKEDSTFLTMADIKKTSWYKGSP